MHVNKANNKKYIGITKDINSRWQNKGSKYLGKNKDGSYRHPAFAYALKKYADWDNDWSHEIILSNLSYEEALKKEIELIALYKTNCNRYKNPTYGYNLTDGGEGNSGRPISEITRQKIREAHLGMKASEETRRKQSEVRKGRKMSESAKQKIREAKSGENNPNYGKHLSEETKKKLSEALSGEKNPMYGKKRPQEIIDKMVNGAKQKWEDPEFRASMSAACSERTKGKKNPKAHPIVQLTLDYIFVKSWDYIGEAAKYFNVSEASIRACCSGKQKTSCEFKWMYKEDYEEWIKSNVL